MLYVLLNALCPTEDIQAWLLGHEGATIDTDCAREAAQKFIDWSEAGYLPTALTGIGHDDAAVAWPTAPASSTSTATGTPPRPSRASATTPGSP